jgi:hypothetical protein
VASFVKINPAPGSVAWSLLQRIRRARLQFGSGIRLHRVRIHWLLGGSAGRRGVNVGTVVGADRLTRVLLVSVLGHIRQVPTAIAAYTDA